jgi:hypothetical protein
MRLSDERYEKDLRKLALARRMVRHEARTGSIMEWTGLSQWRLRMLWRQETGEEDELAPLRHRGPMPSQLNLFYNSPLARSEAGALASSFRLHSVIPLETGPGAIRRLAGLDRGERLCDAFEGYVSLVPEPRYSLDHAIQLLRALVLGDELAVAHCLGCRGVLVIDRLARGAPRCVVCRTGPLPGLSLPGSDGAKSPALAPEPVEVQQSLF